METTRDTGWNRVAGRAGYVAAGWAVAFALVHLYWLADGRLGLPEGRSVWSSTPLLVIDVIAVPLCVVAAAVALAPLRRWGRRVPARLLTGALWGTTALLVLHAAPSVPDWFALAFGSRSGADLDAMARFATFGYEPFFLVGGLLFALTSLGHRASLRSASRSASASVPGSAAR
ncbi:DUF3995 domain-containing protein [Kitasatospora xanthocidica]|uniref:DUF3995 domain-containing protein n=1 Tax=Kitasatospora xanthocidica TaxID=83382 RepID=UPI001673F420|nr:DUF3995 domain-containing protein [Kitasatospora xanthocidica]